MTPNNSPESFEHFFQTIIETNKGILLKIARTYCQNPEDRQDLIQEMKVQIWLSLHKFNHQVKITTWLYRVALNVAISFYRKNVNRQNNSIPLSEKAATIPEMDKSDHEQQLLLLEQFIHQLNDLDKALMLLYLEEKSHAEISDILGISVSNVSTKIARIKERLKKRFLLQTS